MKSHGPPFVYFFRNANYVKIGKATDVEARRRECQTGNPLPITIIGTVFGDVDTEREFQRRFAAYHERGEWYAYVGDLRDFLTEEFGTPRMTPLPQGSNRCPWCGANFIHIGPLRVLVPQARRSGARPPSALFEIQAPETEATVKKLVGCVPSYGSGTAPQLEIHLECGNGHRVLEALFIYGEYVRRKVANAYVR